MKQSLWLARLKALQVFVPAAVVIFLLHVVFVSLEQGRDVVRQTLESPMRLVFFGYSAVFLAYVTWYGARLRGFIFFDKLRLLPSVRRFAPRFLGHATFLAALVGLLRVGDGLGKWTCDWSIVVIILLDVLVFVFIHYLSQGLKELVGPPMAAGGVQREAPSAAEASRIRRWLYGLVVLLLLLPFGLMVPGFIDGVGRLGPMLILGAMQVVFGILVSVRSGWIRSLNPEEWAERRDVQETWLDRLFPRDRGVGSASQEEMLPYATERRQFIWFNVIALSITLCMVLLWFWQDLTPHLGAFAMVWLSVALLIGFFNGLGALSRGSGFPFGITLLLVIYISGHSDEQHKVAVVNRETRSSITRPKLIAHLDQWARLNGADTSGNATIPMVFVLADGGASRSGHWVARVLERLHRSDPDFHNRLFMLSGASGGAVGIATHYQVAHSYQAWDSVPRTFDTPGPLAADLLTPTLTHMLGPDMFNLVVAVTGDRARALERAMERSDSLWQDSVRTLFGASGGAYRPALFLNTTCMNNGRPGIVSSIDLDSSISKRIDVLDSLPDSLDMRLSTAAVLSARFPYISPAGFIEREGRKLYFVDGGYFDNSGAGVVIEMLQAIERMRDTDTTRSWLKRVRPLVVHISNTAPPSRRDDGGVHQLANEVATPALTVLGTYASQTNINDDRLRDHLKRGYPGRTSYIEVNLYKSTKPVLDEFSMSWSMSTMMRDRMDSLALVHPEVDRILQSLRNESLSLH